MPSGQSRVYRVIQLRTDGVNCQESTDSGLVALKVVLVTGAAFAGQHRPTSARLSFPASLCESKIKNVQCIAGVNIAVSWKGQNESTS